MKRLLHPATAIATLALFVAFAGGAAAYASGLIPGSHIKNHSISEAKLTKAAIKSLHGGPRAYAEVNPKSGSPAFIAARTKGFSAVDLSSTGVYCLTFAPGVSTAASAPIVGVEWAHSGGDNLAAYWRDTEDGNNCDPATQLEVQTYKFTAGGDNAASNSVAFTVLVP
jgi:hypothetical protein